MVVTDVATGEMVGGAPVARHNDRVTSVAFSPNGRFVASGSFDTTVVITDVETGEIVGGGPIKHHSNTVTSVVFSPDGRYIISGSFDDTAIVTDVETGEKLATVTQHSDTVMAVAYSPNGRHIVSASWDGTVIVTDLFFLVAAQLASSGWPADARGQAPLQALIDMLESVSSIAPVQLQTLRDQNGLSIFDHALNARQAEVAAMVLNTHNDATSRAIACFRDNVSLRGPLHIVASPTMVQADSENQQAAIRIIDMLATILKQDVRLLRATPCTSYPSSYPCMFDSTTLTPLPSYDALSQHVPE